MTVRKETTMTSINHVNRVVIFVLVLVVSLIILSDPNQNDVLTLIGASASLISIFGIYLSIASTPQYYVVGVVVGIILAMLGILTIPGFEHYGVVVKPEDALLLGAVLGALFAFSICFSAYCALKLKASEVLLVRVSSNEG